MAERGWGEMLARAVEVKKNGATVLGAGIAVQVTPEGEHIGLVYGGHQDSVDEDAVMVTARAAFADWPFMISRVTILVSDRNNPNAQMRMLTPNDRRQLALAKAKRDARAKRHRELLS